jgi:hypothetical protein
MVFEFNASVEKTPETADVVAEERAADDELALMGFIGGSMTETVLSSVLATKTSSLDES